MRKKIFSPFIEEQLSLKSVQLFKSTFLFKINVPNYYTLPLKIIYRYKKIEASFKTELSFNFGGIWYN